ncbi:MAG: L-fucose/L-arabinose isomerase family protein [Anaerolineales bacterium]
MIKRRKLKVGLAGLMCTPFRGDKESQYAARSEGLKALAERLDFELHVVRQGMYTREQAQAAAHELASWGADFILLQTSSFGPGDFLYEFTALPAYLGLWAVPEGPPTEEGGLPLNSFVAANMYNSIIGTYLLDYTRPVKWFYGPVGQPLFDERLEVTVRALTALVNLRGARVGLVGGVAPGFDNLIVDPRTLRARLGIDVVPIAFDALLKRAKGYDAERVRPAEEALRSGITELQAGQEEALEKSGRVYLAYREIAEAHDLDALAVSCWPRFQDDYRLAVCSVVGRLNSDETITACEGDVPAAVSMLALHHLTGDIVTLMDLSGIDEHHDRILFWHCGPTAPQLANESGSRMGSLWLFDGYEGPSMGLRNDLVLRSGPVTVLGFTTDFDRLLVLDGRISEEPPPYVGSRGWLTDLHVNRERVSVPDLVETLMRSHYQHHYPLVYGNHAAAGLELAAWLGISSIPVSPYTPYLKP